MTKMTVKQATALGIIFDRNASELFKQIEELGELSGNATEAMTMIFEKTLSDGRVFHYGVIARLKESA